MHHVKINTIREMCVSHYLLTVGSQPTAHILKNLLHLDWIEISIKSSMGATLIGPSTLYMGSMMCRYDVIEWILNKLCPSCSIYVLNVNICYYACLPCISITACSDLHNTKTNYYQLCYLVPLLVIFDDMKAVSL